MTSHPSGAADDTFIPVLVWPGRRPTFGELGTWYEALANAVTLAVPSDLVACWILPSRGGSLLVGPPGLAGGDLRIPAAEPLLGHEAVFAVEDRLLAAGYRSAMALPIRSEVQDVGLLAVATFAAGRYDREAQRTLTRIAAQLAPSSRRLAAEPWIVPAAVTEEPAAATAAVTESLLDAMDRARTGADLVQLVSDALTGVLPHDRLELVASAPAPECWAQLSLDGVRRHVFPSPEAIDRIDALVHHLGFHPTARVADLAAEELAWPGGADQRGTARTRALLAARLSVGGEFVGWLWLGSETRDWFRAEEEATARLAARLLSGRVAAWSTRLELSAVR